MVKANSSHVLRYYYDNISYCVRISIYNLEESVKVSPVFTSASCRVTVSYDWLNINHVYLTHEEKQVCMFIGLLVRLYGLTGF